MGSVDGFNGGCGIANREQEAACLQLENQFTSHTNATYSVAAWMN